MTKKLTKQEWFDKFDKEYSKEIDKFRISGTTLFDNEDITEELIYFAGSVVHDMYRVKLNISKLEDYNNGDEFTLTDYNGVQFFAAEYYKGKLSIGVIDKRKRCFGHVLSFDKDAVKKTIKVIKLYLKLFKSTMDARNTINEIIEAAGNRNI
jgi:hypothetical protein